MNKFDSHMSEMLHMSLEDFMYDVEDLIPQYRALLEELYWEGFYPLDAREAIELQEEADCYAE